MVHPHPLSKQEIRERYDGFAKYYDLVEALPELLGVRSLRRWLANRAHGRTLEVAAGSGKNLGLLPRDIELIAGDISTAMLQKAAKKAKRASRQIEPVILDAEQLPFVDDSFDTVISTLSTCTFPDPQTGLREMARVCRPDGRILLLEHGRSSNRILAWYQDKRADKHAAAMGCQWNREPVRIARDAGLDLVESSTHFFDIFAVMEARPVKDTSSHKS